MVATAPLAKSEPVDPRSRCEHGEGSKCLNCLDVADAQGGKKKKKKKEKPIAWLCQHGPEAKCVNCLKVKKADAKKANPCNHPPSMSCTACLPGAGEPVPEGGKTGTCQHGPNGMCVHCAPPDIDEAAAAYDAIAAGEDLAAKIPVRSCRNHGPQGSCLECMSIEESSKLTLKRQKTSATQTVAINNAALGPVINVAIASQFTKLPSALLLGRHKKSGTTVVEAAHSPSADLTLLDDPDLERVVKLAGMTGLSVVGCLFCVPERDAVDMSAHEVAQAAALQARFGRRFVTVLAKATRDSTGALTAHVEPFQVTDQAVILHARKVLPVGGQDRGTGLVRLEEEVLVERAPVRAAPAAFFLVPLAVRAYQGKWGSTFPTAGAVRPSDLKVYFMQHTNAPYTAKLSDFNLLLQLSRSLDMTTDMPSLCAAVVAGSDADLEGFKMIIEAMVA